MNYNNLLSSTRTTMSLLLALSIGLPAIAASGVKTTTTPAAEAAIKASKAPANEEDPTLQYLPILPQTAETIDKLKKFEAEGEAAFQKHDLDKALSKWQEAYGLSKEMRSSEGEGRALTNMCRLYYDRGQLVRAKELGENALEVLNNSSDQKAIARARVAMAQVYFKQDNHALAGQLLEMAMKSYAELGVDDAPDAAKVMNLAGNLLANTGKLKESIPFFQNSASYYGKAGDYANEISMRTAIAAMYQELGYLVAGEEEANQALTSALNSKDPALVVGALATLANCQYNLGEYENALQKYDMAMATQVKLADQLAVAQFQAGYGSTLSALGELESAKKYLENACTILKTKGNALSQATLLNSLAIVETQLSQYQSAFQHFQQAMEMQAIATPRRPKLNVIIMQNLAYARARSGDNRGAKQTLTAILTNFKKLDNQFLEGRTYAALGEICLTLKETAAAESFIKQGIAISEKVHDDASLWRNYTNLAQVYITQAQIPQAQPLTQQQLQQQQQQIKDTLNSAVSFIRSPQAGNFGSPESLNFPSSREDLSYKLVSLLVGQKMAGTAYSVAAQLKEESFITDWKRSQGIVKAADQEIYNDLYKQRIHIHAAEVGSNPTNLVKEWQNWMSRFAQLAAENKPLARLIAPLPLTAQEITKLAQQKHLTVLDYFVGSNGTMVFSVNPQGKLTAFNLPVGRKQLESQVASLISASTKPETSATTPAVDADKKMLQILGSELLPANVMATLPKNEDDTLVVIPDAVLLNVPFAALVDNTGKFLVESHTLSMFSSAAALIDGASSQDKTAGQNVVLAEPATGTVVKTSAEVNAVASAFEPENITMLTGKTSLPELEEKTAGNSYLHLATQLTLPANDPLMVEIPVLVNKGKNSPKLSAKQLFQTNLSPDLFVLSGTTVNAKDTRGHAVKVFSRGLNYTGARNVMMSLWQEPVEDRSGQLAEFYKESHGGLSRAKSLRKAQLKGLSRNASPRLWAAYQIWGPSF